MRPGVALVAALVISAPAQASPLPEYPFIFTSGSAEIDVPPDIVRFRVEVSAHLPEANAAMSAVEVTSKRLLAVLKTAGVKEADIDASDIEKSPQRHWDEKRDRSVPDGFEVTRRFSVTVRDLGSYPQVVTTLLELPHTAEFEPYFDRTDRAKIEGELFDRAAQDARAKAERMAAAFGRKLGSVRGIAQVPMTEIADWLGLPTNATYPASMELDSQSRRLLVPAARFPFRSRSTSSTICSRVTASSRKRPREQARLRRPRVPTMKRNCRLTCLALLSATLCTPLLAQGIRDVPAMQCPSPPEIKSRSRQRFEATAFMVIATELETQGEKNFLLQYDEPQGECLLESFDVEGTGVAAVYSPWTKGMQTLLYRFVTNPPDSQQRREILALYNGMCGFVMKKDYCFHVSERRDGVISWYAMFRDEPTYAALKPVVLGVLSGTAKPLLSVRWLPGAKEGEIVAFDERLEQ